MRLLKIFSIIAIFVSCNEENSIKTNRIYIDPTDVNSEINTSDFISEAKYLKLSTKEGAQIGAIDKLILKNDRIYILDSRIAVGLFIYDMNGQLLFDIQHYGRGPGEFMGPYDFAIDDVNDEIIIYDARAAKLSKYRLSDGEFIEDVLIDFRFRKFKVLQDQYVFYLDNRPSGELCCNIVVTDKNLNIKDEYLDIKPGMRGSYFSLPKNFTDTENGLFFTAQSDHQIYKITEDNFEEYIYIDFGDFALPDEYFENYDSYEERWETAEGSVKNISNYFVTDSFTFFNYWLNDDIYYYFKSIRTSKTVHFKKKDLNNDLNVGPEFVWPVEIKGDYMIWVQQPNWLFKYLEEKKKDMSNKEWKKFTNDNSALFEFADKLVPGQENPYLVFTKIRLE